MAEELSLCLICSNTQQEPKKLEPCQHSFCLCCLVDKFGGNESGGTILKCPKCSLSFVVPKGGIKCLKTNDFIVKLIEAKTANPCSSCGRCQASFVCVECKENYCLGCATCHKNMTISRSHRVLELSPMENKGTTTEGPSRRCSNVDDLHVYCVDCNQIVSLRSFSTNHKTHVMELLPDVLERKKKKLNKQIGIIDSKCERINTRLNLLQLKVSECETKGRDLKMEVSKRAGELKIIIDNRVDKLHGEIQEKVERYKMDNGEVKKQLEDTRSNLSSAKVNYSEELISESLEGNVEYYFMIDEDEDADDDDIPLIQDHLQLKFNAVDIDDQLDIGSVVSFTGSGVTREAKRKGTFVCSDEVSGMSTRGDLIYIITPCSSHLEVYNVETYQRSNNINIPSFSSPFDIVVLNNLYVTHGMEMGSNFTVVDLLDGDSKRLKITPQCRTMSKTSDDKILITNGNKLHEYSVKSAQTREIILPSSLESIDHAIQLDQNVYLVCNEKEVSIVDGKDVGNLTFDDLKPGQKTRKFSYLTRDKSDNVYVADSHNKEILVLGKDLRLSYSFVLEKEPQRLCYHEAKGLLFVSFFFNNEIAVYQV